jgi:hypothetical protein
MTLPALAPLSPTERRAIVASIFQAARTTGLISPNHGLGEESDSPSCLAIARRSEPHNAALTGALTRALQRLSTHEAAALTVSWLTDASPYLDMADHAALAAAPHPFNSLPLRA